MNIYDKLLNAAKVNFEKLDFFWHENPVFKLKSDLKESEVYLGQTNNPLIFLSDLKLKESKFEPDYLIFASRHRSETARPAFLVHTTGNWDKKTEFGGEPQELSKTSALLHKAGFITLLEKDIPLTLKNFSIDIEVTHHGPTKLDEPLIFIELGSSKGEWKIKDAGELLASSIIQLVDRFIDFKKQSNQVIVLGFGGTHYAPNFRRLIIDKKIAMSFICPKYYIQELDEVMIRKMIDNTTEKVDYFLIDWKGTNSEDKKHLIPLLEQFNIPIKKTKEI
ncbi:MAG: D-aminoacyl-tRNA deacylase [Promethearchaeota archaeon]